MIPESFIEHWRTNTKWQTPAMIEQDLIISRALICLYNHPTIKESLVFRGGTALNKLFLNPPARYSEDIDFVQIRAEPIGKTIDTIRELLKDWLGEPKRKITMRSAKLIYQYSAIGGLPARLKIEINILEHFQVLPLQYEQFTMDSQWFKGKCIITTHALEELMATKLRAIYQRRKGRDLFDLWLVIKQDLVDIQKVIPIFKQYCAQENTLISKSLFEKNMALKRLNRDFQTDMKVLLPHQTNWDFDEAFEFVQNKILDHLG